MTAGQQQAPVAAVTAWWESEPILTPRQRDVQDAHRVGFWSGFRRGIILGNAIGLPPFLGFLIWWWTR